MNVVDLNGKTFQLHKIKPKHTVDDLSCLVACELNAEGFLIRLGLDQRMFGPEHSDVPVGDLGITEGSTLKCEKVMFECGYYCTEPHFVEPSSPPVWYFSRDGKFTFEDGKEECVRVDGCWKLEGGKLMLHGKQYYYILARKAWNNLGIYELAMTIDQFKKTHGEQMDRRWKPPQRYGSLLE